MSATVTQFYQEGLVKHVYQQLPGVAYDEHGRTHYCVRWTIYDANNTPNLPVATPDEAAAEDASPAYARLCTYATKLSWNKHCSKRHPVPPTCLVCIELDMTQCRLSSLHT